MSRGIGQVNTTSSRTSPGGDQEPGVPLITWLIGGAALVIVLTAGALFLHEEPKEAAEPAAPEPTSNEKPQNAAVEQLAPKDPLEITASFLDAQQRGKLFSPAAALSGIEVVVEDGKTISSLVFDFGEAVGQPVPGVPLLGRRHAISYDGDAIDETTTASSEKRFALPEPNCPLEVAFRKLSQSGVSTEGRVGVLYLQSKKHGRPVWLMTSKSGETTSISADSCALLRR